MKNITDNTITHCDKCWAPRFYSEINFKLWMCRWCEIEDAVDKFWIKHPFLK